MTFQKKMTSLLQGQKFIEQALKVSSETESSNGALKYTTSGDIFVDNFVSIAYFKQPRSYDEVSKDMSILWSENPKENHKKMHSTPYQCASKGTKKERLLQKTLKTVARYSSGNSFFVSLQHKIQTPVANKERQILRTDTQTLQVGQTNER